MRCYNKTMNTLFTLAQADSELYYTTTTTSVDDATAIGLMIVMLFFWLIFSVIAYVVTAIFLGMIFKKAGLAAWTAWVPVYNGWKLLEIGGQQGFWAVLALIPFVNIVSIVFVVIAEYHIGLKLGKQGAFVLLAIFLPIVWLIWLAVDGSKWNEKAAGAAPSLAKGPKAVVPAKA